MKTQLSPEICSDARRFLALPRRILGVVVLGGFLLAVAMPWHPEPAEPLFVTTVLVTSGSRCRRKGRRVRWLRPRALCFAMRVCRDAVVLSSLVIVNLVGDCGQCSAVIGVFLMLLRESLHTACMARGDVRWLRISVVVERLFRMAVMTGLWFAIGHFVCPCGSELLGLAAGSLSGRSEATVRVEGNHVVISTGGTAITTFSSFSESAVALHRWSSTASVGDRAIFMPRLRNVSPVSGNAIHWRHGTRHMSG